MGKKWYVVTAARPGTRLGVWDNWLELAPNVKGFSRAIWKGFESEEEALLMWEQELARQAERARQARGRNHNNRARAQAGGYAYPPAPLYDVSVGSDDETHSRNSENVTTVRPRSITLNGTSSYGSPRARRPSSEAAQRGTSTARATSRSAVARPHSIHSPDGLRSGVQLGRAPTASCSTQTHMVRTRSATSDRTSSWVAGMTAALPAVPESPARASETSRIRMQSRRDGAVGVNLLQSPISVDIASPNDRRATVDTSYSDAYASAVTVSSSASSLSSEEGVPRPSPRSPQARTLARGPQVWIDNGFPPRASLRVQPGSNRASSSESSLPARVTQSNSPHRIALPPSRAASTPEVWTTPLSHISSVRDAYGNSVAPSPRKSPRRSPSRSSRATPQTQPAPRTPEHQRTLVASSDASPTSSCQCRHLVCPCCHLPTMFASSSDIDTGFGFTEPPHIANIMYASDADPRSPRKGGSAPVHPTMWSRPSPLIPALIPAHAGSLFSH